MPRVNFVKKARKDNPVAKAGEPYYWWKFRYGGKHYSKTPPKPSQLTQSEFLCRLYGLQESIGESRLVSIECVESDLDEIKTELQDLAEMCQDSLDSMPEALQDTSQTGEMLTERIDGCEEWENEIDNIEIPTSLEITCSNCEGGCHDDCKECNGSGVINENDDQCPECEGEAIVDCPECDGDGTIMIPVEELDEHDHADAISEKLNEIIEEVRNSEPCL